MAGTLILPRQEEVAPKAPEEAGGGQLSSKALPGTPRTAPSVSLRLPPPPGGGGLGRHRLGSVLVALTLLISAPVLADSLMPAAHYANEQLPDPAKEAEAKALMTTLRCLVCQGQSIADSDAEMAGDMRALVRTRIAAGEKPEAIRAWLIERYGNWVSYEPPLDAVTWPLWGLPILFIGFGLWLARGRFKRRGKR